MTNFDQPRQDNQPDSTLPAPDAHRPRKRFIWLAIPFAIILAVASWWWWHDSSQYWASLPLETLRAKAKNGVAEAQFALANKYDIGDGVEQDHAEAAKWFRKAAEQGLAKAQGNLGLMYDNGRGVPQSDTAAFGWGRIAADQGNAKAQNNRERTPFIFVATFPREEKNAQVKPVHGETHELLVAQYLAGF